MENEQLEEATDSILDVLEHYNLNVLESVAVIEVIKFNLMRQAEEAFLREGVTLQ